VSTVLVSAALWSAPESDAAEEPEELLHAGARPTKVQAATARVRTSARLIAHFYHRGRGAAPFYSAGIGSARYEVV